MLTKFVRLYLFLFLSRVQNYYVLLKHLNSGDIRTSFLSGAKVNISWHLGYPHKVNWTTFSTWCVATFYLRPQGGFKIQLLDQLERPVLDLTPSVQGAEFVADDATYVVLKNMKLWNILCLFVIVGRKYFKWSCRRITRVTTVHWGYFARHLSGDQITNFGLVLMWTLKQVSQIWLVPLVRIIP